MAAHRALVTLGGERHTPMRRILALEPASEAADELEMALGPPGTLVQRVACTHGFRVHACVRVERLLRPAQAVEAVSEAFERDRQVTLVEPTSSEQRLETRRCLRRRAAPEVHARQHQRRARVAGPALDRLLRERTRLLRVATAQRDGRKRRPTRSVARRQRPLALVGRARPGVVADEFARRPQLEPRRHEAR